MGGFTVGQLWSQLWSKLVDQLQQSWRESWPTLPWNTLNCRKHKVGMIYAWNPFGMQIFAYFGCVRSCKVKWGTKLGSKLATNWPREPRFASQLDEVGQTLSFQLGKSWSPNWGSSWATVKQPNRTEWSRGRNNNLSIDRCCTVHLRLSSTILCDPLITNRVICFLFPVYLPALASLQLDVYYLTQMLWQVIITPSQLSTKQHFAPWTPFYDLPMPSDTDIPGLDQPLDYEPEPRRLLPNLLLDDYRHAYRSIFGNSNPSTHQLPLTTLREFTMLRIMDAITDKTDWNVKVRNASLS